MKLFKDVWTMVRGARRGEFAVSKDRVRPLVSKMIEEGTRQGKTKIESLGGFEVPEYLGPASKRPADGPAPGETAPKREKPDHRPHPMVTDTKEEDEMLMAAIMLSLDVKDLKELQELKELKARQQAAMSKPAPPQPLPPAAPAANSSPATHPAAAASPEKKKSITAAAEEKKEEECGCCLRTRTELLEAGEGGLQPIIISCDQDSPARCTHLICSQCEARSVDAFLADPQRPMLKCVECERKNVPIRRRAIDMGVGQYIVDPATFAFRMTNERKDALRAKRDYIRAISGAVGTFEQELPHGGLRCPLCKKAADGPVTRACPNLARCKNLRCLTVFCIYCMTAETHDNVHCPTLLNLKEIATEPFDPKNGRRCPYPGCSGVCIQHYRDEGCHIVTCWVCNRKLCFVCGYPKSGDEHHPFDGRSCNCAVNCDARCPCIVFKPAGPPGGSGPAPAAPGGPPTIRTLPRPHQGAFPTSIRHVDAHAEGTLHGRRVMVANEGDPLDLTPLRSVMAPPADAMGGRRSDPVRSPAESVEDDFSDDDTSEDEDYI
jgi:hypothetical protein